MKSYFSKLAKWIVPAATLLVPTLAWAIPTPQTPGVTAPIQAPTIATTGAEALGIVCTVLYWLFAILIVVTVLFAIAAAFKYLTAGGDPEKVAGANHMLIYAAVAIVVALLARGFPYIITNVFGVTAVAC